MALEEDVPEFFKSVRKGDLWQTYCDIKITAEEVSVKQLPCSSYTKYVLVLMKNSSRIAKIRE